MKTNKFTYFKKISSFADWFLEFYPFYEHLYEEYCDSTEEAMDIPELKSMLSCFCKKLYDFNSVAYKLIKMNAEIRNNDTFCIMGIITRIAFANDTKQPLFNCMKNLCMEYRTSFLNDNISRDGIISESNGEFIYNFKTDTPESFFEEYCRSISNS